MRRTLTTLAACCAALAIAAGVANAQGTLSDRTTFVTFSGPVSLPGMTLPAGTYTFKLADSQTDRHIVQVFDREQTKLFTTLLAVPAQRAEAKGDPVITFKETPADRPPAVHYWYYAGEKDGNELVYPKAQAIQIAQASGEGVMAIDSNDMKTGNMSRVTAADAQQPATPAQPPEPQPSTPPPTPTTAQPTTPAEPAAPPATPQQPTATPEQPAPTPPPAATPSVPPPSATDTERPVGTSGSLPATASELPLVGLIGLLSLGAALALRVARTA